ncbi:MAG: ABC transporter permease, partial [Lachnospiraceae bacterium]|nr:ABC transporter permease [Lachnospiraceae bacterium]
SSAFSVRNAMNAGIKKYCPVDAEISFQLRDKNTVPIFVDMEEAYKNYGLDATTGFKEYIHFNTYYDPDFTFGSYFGHYADILMSNFTFFNLNTPETIVKLSDYNRLMRLYDKEELQLFEGEYAVIGNFKTMVQLRNEILKEGNSITLFGCELQPRYKECIDGYIDININAIYDGAFIVPDNIVPESSKGFDYIFGNYDASGKEEYEAVENMVLENFDNVFGLYQKDFNTAHEADKNNFVLYGLATTKELLKANGVGISAILTFIGLYIGMIFLLACGAILSLKSLTEAVDSLPNYEILRKIGADENEINRSLFRQNGIFFLLPLLLAAIHSIFGMKFAVRILENIGMEDIASSIALTCVVLLIIYGGYFAITYFNSKNIIRNRQ